MTHRADDDLLDFLGGRLAGVRVIDCGCGPGIFTAKLAAAGASYVLAVDANRSMLRQAKARLAGLIAGGTVAVRQDFVDGRFFERLEGPFDVVVFKRMLYAPRQVAVGTLAAAVAALPPAGMVAVVHPERSWRRYALGRPPRLRRYTPFHLVNRAVSALGAGVGIGQYQTYSATGLRDLLAEAAPGHRVELVPTSQPAYNIAAVVVSAQLRRT